MKFIKNKEMVKRYEKNPILTIDDIPVVCSSVFNAGVTMCNGQYLMLLRIEGVDRLQHFRVATSDNGYSFKVSKEPVVFPKDEYFETYEGTIYDPRITKIDDTYYICYAAHSYHGVRIGIAKTKDFKIFERVALGSEIENRNAVLFPEKIKGLYVRLDRPTGILRNDLWISYSPDLIYWGQARCIAKTRWQSWDETKIGAGAVPIKTSKGWLEIYHGVAGRTYRLGCMLLDLKDPSKVIARTKGYILAPRELYERVGDVPNVVFTSGAILEEDGEVKIYYGAADQCVCVATAKLDDLVEACFNR